MRREVLFLILIATAIRLAFGAAIGLGVDESYMVAAGRVLSLGYFDHPPAAWWLSWSATHLFGTEAPVAVRLPFILLFALTTWLMAALGQEIGGPRAGFWAAATLNLSPVFGITSGGWVLPDGPLDCALTGAALCLIRALPGGPFKTRYWLGAGACAGLALFSKYSAVLTISGAVLFLLLDPGHRAWLRRWQPYAAAAVALLIFSPVIVWNSQHDWASFAFQGARAAGPRFRPLEPLVTLAGEALFVLPWFAVPMLVAGAKAFRSGWRERALACLALPPIVVFAAISAWSSQRILYHWAAPGFLMLFPLLGCFVARHLAWRSVRAGLIASAALCVTGLIVVSLQVRLDLFRALMPARDPTAEGLDWISLRDDLAARGLLRPGTVVGVPNWRDAGKIAHALGSDIPVLCLNRDSRQFGFAHPPAAQRGADILLLAVDHPEIAIPALSGQFSRIETLPPSSVTLRGRVLKPIAVVLGKSFSPAD